MKKGSVEWHIAKLEKTQTSARNFIGRGGNYGTQYGYTLIDRYNYHREELRRIDRAAWKAWCEEEGSCPSHDGYDLFA